MPNWCDNQITITGDKSVIDKIEKIVKEEKERSLDFLQFMYPMPKELEARRQTVAPTTSTRC